MKTLNKLLGALIEGAKVLGLGENDINNAKEFLEYNEFGLSFDTITTQMYEHDIEINNEYYLLINKIATLLKLPLQDYAYTKELITDENNISKSIKEKISFIVNNVN